MSVWSGWRHPAAERRRYAILASLYVRNYRLYAAGQAVAVTGSWAQNVAVGWLALELSHSGVVLGVVTAARFAPLVLLGPWGGLVADRSDTRRLLVITQSCAAVLAAVLGTVTALGWTTLPVVFGVVLGQGLVNVLDVPARQRLISQLVDREHLGNAIALNSVVINGSRMLGPGVAGAVITTLGVSPCFFANSLSYLVVIASLFTMRPSEFVSTEQEVRAKGQVRAGVRHVLSTPDLRAALAMVVVAGVFAWEFPVTIPLVTSSTFGGDAHTYGLAMSCLGAGSVCGGVAAARRRRIGLRSLAASAVLWGSAIGCAAVAPTLPVEYLLLALVGSGAVTFNAAAKTLLQVRAAAPMRGRVMALWSIGWQGSTVLGAPLVGFVGNSLGPRFALLVGGVATVGVGLWHLAHRPARTTEPKPAEGDPGAAAPPGPVPPGRSEVAGVPELAPITLTRTADPAGDSPARRST